MTEARSSSSLVSLLPGAFATDCGGGGGGGDADADAVVAGNGAD